jgi:uncharacterized protein (DUF1778 family)
MVKKRTAIKATQDSSSFIKGAAIQTASPADPRASNDYKKISLSMNQYTYDLLTEAAEIEQRSLVQTMRLAIQKYAKDVIKNN